MLKDIILEGRDPVSIDVLEKIEGKLGVTFPNSFKEIILYKDSAVFKKSLFKFKEFISGDEWRGCLGSILSFAPGLGELGILWHTQKFKEQIGDGLIPVAEDPGGDFVCFDYRKGKDNPNPPIIYWSHESPENEDISYVADNFDDFINMLYGSEE